MKDTNEQPGIKGERTTFSTINRRRFLQVTGTASAGVCLGIFVSNAPKDAADAQMLALNSATGAYPPISNEEAIARRHTRHRRQAMDGFVDTPQDPFNKCEHDCAAAMFAHHYKGREQWP